MRSSWQHAAWPRRHSRQQTGARGAAASVHCLGPWRVSLAWLNEDCFVCLPVTAMAAAPFVCLPAAATATACER
jgi:hypothetical protein